MRVWNSELFDSLKVWFLKYQSSKYDYGFGIRMFQGETSPLIQPQANSVGRIFQIPEKQHFLCEKHMKIAQNRSTYTSKIDDFWQFGICDRSNSVSKFTTGSQRIFETNGSENMIR